ncbi:alpha/beta fold hydrolase [Lentzea californiensis]|uniref:alpha/beta fold hydrolase n=1 Tax=Lentzea californiensis TaxID=438851 RepID=UPI002164B38F|nr:alpha/beta hydrolase [Lentzea californiensis]MCR3746628.1 Alpha/beta hydrolase family [Lentzea californiensis]
MITHSYGSGSPVTLVAHGLGATPGEARIPASGLPGTRVVVTLPSHGDAPDAPEGYWDYGRIAADLGAVPADQAVGVSLGAGALVRLLSVEPGRFARVALLLPAVLDQRRESFTLQQLSDLTAGPPVYVAERRAALARLEAAAGQLPGQVAVPDASVLAAVSAPVLVIGAVGDPLHPEDVAKATAAAFPAGELWLIDSPSPMITHRTEIRHRLVSFLAG